MVRFLARFIGPFSTCRRTPPALLRFASAQVFAQRRRQPRVTPSRFTGRLFGLVLVQVLILVGARHGGIYATGLS
ncbi:MAG TPA: hypothetical protein VIV09_06220, partial [Pseudolabrys sp.]